MSSELFTFVVEKDGGLFLFFFVEYIVYSFFIFKLWIFTLLWIVNVTLPKPTWGLKHENLRARKLIGTLGKLL